MIIVNVTTRNVEKYSKNFHALQERGTFEDMPGDVKRDNSREKIFKPMENNKNIT